jgi:hypothetical protein
MFRETKFTEQLVFTINNSDNPYTILSRNCHDLFEKQMNLKIMTLCLFKELPKKE